MSGLLGFYRASQPGSGIDAIMGQSPVDPAPFLGAAPLPT